MPFSTVCVSTVSSRPRAWSSHSNIPSKYASCDMMTEEIAVYRASDDLYRSPTLSRRVPGRHGYDLPDKSHRKDKKWSLSNIFRRKKKGDEDEEHDVEAIGSGSSSDGQEGKRGFLGMRKRKTDAKRKRRVKTIGTFDHVVLPRKFGSEENGVLSDPTGGFCNYVGRPLPQTPNEQSFRENDVEHSNSRISLGSVDSSGRRSRKEMTKARAEARRTSSRNASSSDEESQRSNSSLQIRSEENLRPREAPMSKKSRAARTERYFKRHSRDGENPHNYLRLSKSDAENSCAWNENRSPSRSPLPHSNVTYANTGLSGLSTIPPSHNNHTRFRVSNSTSNPSYKPPQSMNEYNHSTRRPESLQDQRSVSYDANIHQAPEMVLHVQFPIIRGPRNLSMIDQSAIAKARARQPPPPPPPRDPTRLHHLDRPTTFYLDKRTGSFQPGLRSSSEDHLPREPREKLSYLTDRNPRSRRPIQVQTDGGQKALDFWKRIDMQSNNKPTQMFTSRTSVRNKVFLPSVQPSKEDLDRSSKSFSQSTSRGTEKTENLDRSSKSFFPRNDRGTLDQVSKDDIKRKSANLEEALDELEAIYNSLRLGDEDLLERAEQREKESQELKHQLAHPNYSARGTLSDSSFSYEPFDCVDSPRRKCMSRKNRTADLKHDDMAFRKLNKERSNTINDPQAYISRISYLEASPVHGKAFVYDGPQEPDEPDITQDDVVYRNFKDANTRLKVVEPQPPFGIPLGPIAPAANSDYLHARHQDVLPYRPLFKHKKIPDVIKDDLAFRNLRKDDNKGPALPPLSTEDYMNNNLDSLSYLKKKRAQRSLSANIGSLIHQEVIDRAKRKQNNNVENEFKTLTDIADAMEIARKVLREKDERITATKKAFMSDTDTKPSNNYREDRLTFLNSLRASPNENVLSTKPPRGLTPPRRSPKESTPIPLSPLEAIQNNSISSSSSSLDEILNALAEEAKGTTERITNEIKLLTEDEEPHAKLCERLLECVVDSTNLMASAKPTESEEVVEAMEEEKVEAEAANMIVEREERDASDHDYENLHSDKELEEKCRSPFEEHRRELIASFQELKRNVEGIELPSSRKSEGDGSKRSKEKGSVEVKDFKEVDRPKQPGEKGFHEQSVGDAKSFQESRRDVTGADRFRNVLRDNSGRGCGESRPRDLRPPEERSKSLHEPRRNAEKERCEEVSVQRDQETEERIRVEEAEDSHRWKGSKSFQDSPPSGIDGSHRQEEKEEEETFQDSNVVDDEELRSIYESDEVTGEDCAGDEFVVVVALRGRECASNANRVDSPPPPNRYTPASETSSGFHSSCSLESLKSPKLVMATASRMSSGASEVPRSSRLVLEASRNEAGRGKTSGSWYGEPANVALACSYGIACAHQLASLDLFAVLGVLFAVISFIAALFL